MKESRVLPSAALTTIAEYTAVGGGAALVRARELGPDAVLDEITRSGLGGRGGAGFPAGRKWAAVRANASELERSAVVVNAAEGEPGSFKDRAIIRANPYAIVEGALVAARAVSVPTSSSSVRRARSRTRSHCCAPSSRTWKPPGGPTASRSSVFEGPNEYLYGEETALLEVIDGRYPFPRIAPPYRRGVDEVVDRADDVQSDSSSAAHVELAGPGDAAVAPPTLASNVETFVNAALIVAHGSDWWRERRHRRLTGNDRVHGERRRHRAGVGEFAMGTPLIEVLETLGGGPRDGALVGRRHLGRLERIRARGPVRDSHESRGDAGDRQRPRNRRLHRLRRHHRPRRGRPPACRWFLAVESCGQCAACKDDGLMIADVLDRIATSSAHADDLDVLHDRLATVADGARCNLATQQQVVVGSLIDRFPDAIRRARPPRRRAVGPGGDRGRLGDARWHRTHRRTASREAARLDLRRRRLREVARRSARRPPRARTTLTGGPTNAASDARASG